MVITMGFRAMPKVKELKQLSDILLVDMDKDTKLKKLIEFAEEGKKKSPTVYKRRIYFKKWII
jgi:hypothetical protein